MNITEAQNEIATTLKRLEIDTGGWVTDVEIEDIDTSAWEEAVPRKERIVRIEMRAAPGSNWGQACDRRETK